MRKTKIQMEIAEKKKMDRDERKRTRNAAKDKRTIKDIAKSLSSASTKKKAVTVCSILLCIAIIGVSVGVYTSSNNKNEVNNAPVIEGYNVDDKYVISEDGDIVFLNGDEIISNFPDVYKMGITVSTTNGSTSINSEFTAEVSEGVWYYYGTYNDEKFDEAHIQGEGYSTFLTKAADDNSYEYTDNLHFAYVDGKNLVETVLCGDNITNNDGKYTSTILLDSIVNFIPYIPTEIVDEEIEYVQESASATLYATDDSIFVEIKSDSTNSKIEIEKIDKLSKDFTKYIPQ